MLRSFPRVLNSANCRTGANHDKASASPACYSALLLPRPALVAQDRVTSVTAAGWHKQPKGHKLTGPTARAGNGLQGRKRSGLWLHVAPTKTQQFQGGQGRNEHPMTLEGSGKGERKKNWVCFSQHHLPIKRNTKHSWSFFMPT